MAPRKKQPKNIAIEKALTGIQGLDEITNGGLPKGRPTLVAGRAGSGKTLLGMEFLYHGATKYNEPGVLMTFEENIEELKENFISLGFDLERLVKTNKMILDYVVVERSEIEETGEYNLEGLFVRLDYAIKQIGAKRVVLDTVEALFGGLANESILRAELRRLFRWLKSRGVTAIITGERGRESLTRHGLEEYVADCVIVLDHDVDEHISTRRIQIVKYRGSAHGTDEYPFLIDRDGISVLPISSVKLDYEVAKQRISTGVPRLDSMLSGGTYRGSSVLISGTPGTGKSSLSATFALNSCRRKEKVLYFAFEEAPDQIIRNMRSIGLDLEPCVKGGLFRFHAARPTLYGLEMHLATMHKQVVDFNPKLIVVDPISNLTSTGTAYEVKSMLVRFIDFIKGRGVTGIFTDLITGDIKEMTQVGVSSLMDTWVFLRDIEIGGERNRGIYILKSRGTKHSNQIREFLITSKGLDITDVYAGPEGVLTGSARLAQEAREKAAVLLSRQGMEKKQRDLQRKRDALDAQITLLRKGFESEEEELSTEIQQAKIREQTLSGERNTMQQRRQAGQ